MKYIVFFGEVTPQDLHEIGVKGLNVAMLFKKGFKVPPGFIVSKDVCEMLFKRIKKPVQELSKCKEEQLHEKTEHVKNLIKKLEFTEDIADEIIEAYLSLSVDLEMTAASLLETKEVFVAVRSSYIEEKGTQPELTQKTILNIRGKERLFKGILDCYAANFTPELITYRRDNNVTDFSTAVIVQKMVDSDSSGVAYSLNPDTGRDEIIVNACFGLGEGITSGKVFPDVYSVNKKTLAVKDINIGEKKYAYIRDIETDRTTRHTLGSKSTKQVVYDKDIIEIARIVKKISNSFQKEQKIEWAIKKDVIYILQTKELNVEKKPAESEPKETVEIEVYEEHEDKPDIIDISDTDLDEDLQVLEEIEQIERKQSVEEEKPEETLEEEIEHIVIEKKQEAIAEKSEPESFSIDSPSESSEEDMPDGEPYVEEEPMVEPVEKQIGGELIAEAKETQSDSVSEKETVLGESVEDEPVNELIEEAVVEEKVVEDDSIFSSYKGFDSFSAPESEPEKPAESINVMRVKELARLNAGNTLVYAHMVLKEKLKEKLKQYVREMPDDFDKLLNELLEYENVQNEDDLRKVNEARNNFVSQSKYPEPEIIAMALRLLN